MSYGLGGADFLILENEMKWKTITNFLASVFFLAFWILCAGPAQASYHSIVQEVESVETLVQVGKYRLNFKVIEGSSLAILLESGGGMDSGEWSRLAPELARKTGASIVSYDRAGFGKSDLPETPHDMRKEVEWLWQGLQKLELQKNLILVGHSFGGWMIRLFASEHPEPVRGMVFVDPFTNEFVDLLGVEYLDNHPMAGKIPFDTSQPEKLSKYQRALVRMVGDGLGPKMEIMRKTKIPPGIPIMVITSGLPFLPKTEEQEAWRKSHEQLTASIEGAILIVAEKSDHMVPAREPDLIIEAVDKIIEDLKSVKARENRKKSWTTDPYPVPGSCTIFAASFGNTVLYGNNEDYRIPETYYWSEPSGENTYGGVFLGFDNFFPQGGINEKGLAFDINALPEAPLNPHNELPDHGDIIKKMYQTCATVEQAIALAKKHNWGLSLKGQVLLADATGDAVVISAGPDGELAFTRKPKGDGYLVSTNFNRANPKNTYRGGYPCWRYNKAVEMLEKIKKEKDLRVDYFKSILDACHVQGPGGNTLYSNVFDLKNGVIYLYHWHQFYETAVLKVIDEIAKKKPPTRIKELFSQETVKRAEDGYQSYRKKK
jgi:pimeloyl-ACP methyl ester carboxylesterase